MPEKKAALSLRARNTLTALALTAPTTLASAEGFDTTKLESTATSVLAVGATIAIGFAVFKIGKRAINKV